MESLRGRLLIAGPNLWDPNFRRAVVLVGQHDDDGAVGVVLNRPMDVSVDEVVPALAGLVEPGERLFFGGPVQPHSVVVVADFEDPSASEIIALDSIGFLPPDVDTEDVAGIRRARIFAGYAGWGSGQLETELHEHGSWIVEPAAPDDVFKSDPEQLWTDVLRRKGPEFDLLRTMPVDPSAN